MYLCQNNDCAVCGIIRNGFLLSFIRNRYQRFGRGFYFSSTTSKSNDYNHETSGGLGNRYKSMFLCKVLCGRSHKIQNNDQTLTQPPNGYHCVVGEVGKNLNYDELIIYNEGAVLPLYLIIYSV